MAKTPIVKKYMKKASRTFHEDEEMAPCMSVLARSSFAAIPIVNDDNEVVGLLTEKDVIRTVINWAYDQRAGGSVGNYMSSLEVMVTPEMDLLTAARAFMECNFSCLPVMDGDASWAGLRGTTCCADSKNGPPRSTRNGRGVSPKTPDHERPSAMQEIQKGGLGSSCRRSSARTEQPESASRLGEEGPPFALFDSTKTKPVTPLGQTMRRVAPVSSMRRGVSMGGVAFLAQILHSTTPGGV